MPSVFGRSTVGARSYQEDDFRIIRQNEDDVNSDTLIVVCDGMGGHAAGDVAAKTVVRTFTEQFLGMNDKDPKKRFRTALFVANDTLATMVENDPELKGMGCTIVAALVLQRKLMWISVGDSHLYLLREFDFKKVNADHSMMGEFKELVLSGKMSAEDAQNHPKRNALRSAVTGSPISLIDEGTISLEEKDVLVVATDGLDSLNESELRTTMLRGGGASAQALCHCVLDAVAQKNKPRQDNTTVVILKKGGGQTGTGVLAKRTPRNSVAIIFGGVLSAILVLFLGWFLLSPPPSPAVDNTESPAPKESSSTIGAQESFLTIPNMVNPQNDPQEGGVDENLEKSGSETNSDGSSSTSPTNEGEGASENPDPETNSDGSSSTSPTNEGEGASEKTDPEISSDGSSDTSQQNEGE